MARCSTCEELLTENHDLEEQLEALQQERARLADEFAETIVLWRNAERRLSEALALAKAWRIVGSVRVPRSQCAEELKAVLASQKEKPV
jgi:hypothetical protein